MNTFIVRGEFERFTDRIAIESPYNPSSEKTENTPMFWTHLRTTGLFSLAFIGSVSVLLIAIVATGLLTTYSYSIEHFLPAESTKAIFHNVTNDDLRKFLPWFPALDLEQWEGVRTIALIEDQQGTLEAAVFVKTQMRESPLSRMSKHWHIGEVGPFTVATKSPELLPQLSEKSHKLRRTRAFLELSKQKTPDTQWYFIDLNSIESKSSTEEFFLAFLAEGKTHMTLMPDSKKVIVELFGEEKSDFRSIAPTQQEIAGSWLTLRSRVLQYWWKQKEHLPPHIDQLVSGILETATEKALGPQVSFTFDVLPLFKEETTLYLGSTDSKRSFFLLSGTLFPRKERVARLETLRTKFLEGLPALRLQERSLDKGRFLARDVRFDPTQIIEEKFLQDNWHVTVIRHQSEERQLFVATKATSFLVSNHETAISKAIKQEGRYFAFPRSFSFKRSALKAGGKVDMQALQENLPFLSSMPFSGLVMWSLEEKGRIRVLIVEETKETS